MIGAERMNVVLISTYELGRQPFGLASPAAWLRSEGAEVTCLDLTVQGIDEEPICTADLVAIHVPMHTATRIAVANLSRIKEINPRAHLCFYGLYAPVNADYLRELGAGTILGGEYEQGLVDLVKSLQSRDNGSANQSALNPEISLARQDFLVPDRKGFPPLNQYARLRMPDSSYRTVGFAEASRGCKHLCRHCPVVPVYNGVFRVVQRDVVLEDIRRQVTAGAQHISFGDPDFFNGTGHAIPLVRALHDEHPNLTYDVTVKVEHLLKHPQFLPTLRDTGCLFVTTAVESFDDNVLALLDKGHTEEEFIRVLDLFREEGLTPAPTFIPFMPWISLEGYIYFLNRLAELGLVQNVSPVQLSIRLLIPAGSRLLEIREVWDSIEEFDETALSYRWIHPDPRMDTLQKEIQERVVEAEAQGESRPEIFLRIWNLAHEYIGRSPNGSWIKDQVLTRAPIPYLTEPWYC